MHCSAEKGSLIGVNGCPQAAFLDLKVAGVVARLLSRVMSSSTLGGPEAMALCTMLMEVVMVLFNPDVCLNPATPAADRVVEECPTVAEVITVSNISL